MASPKGGGGATRSTSRTRPTGRRPAQQTRGTLVRNLLRGAVGRNRNYSTRPIRVSTRNLRDITLTNRTGNRTFRIVGATPGAYRAIATARARRRSRMPITRRLINRLLNRR